MLSESAAVAPLRPVLGVCVSLECEPERGTFRSERFCFESPSLVGCVSVDGPCDEEVGATTVS